MSLTQLQSCLESYKHVVWDWNGTLLDDVDCCVQIIASVMKQYGMTPITRQDYLKKFRFPVIEYYKDIGFDFKQHSFEKIAVDWMDAYHQHSEQCQIFSGMKELLQTLRAHGIKSHILTAADEQDVITLTKRLAIFDLFTNIFGQDNWHATGKFARGHELIATISATPADIVLIGDTDHDAEVALVLGIDCILLDGGHQAERSYDELIRQFHTLGRSMRLIARV